jgi:hypothetical protein
MYCKHCGQQIDDNAKFCQNCGNSVSIEPIVNPVPEQTAPDAPVKKKKKKSIFKRWWFWVLAILLLFVMCSGPAEPSVTHPDVSEPEYKAMCSEIAFSELARNPDSYQGQMFKFTGEVIQVIEGSGMVDIRMNVTKIEDEYFDWVYYEDTIYAIVRVADGADKILEGDIITIYGICCGDYTYESILGSQVTLPKIEAMYYNLSE